MGDETSLTKVKEMKPQCVIGQRQNNFLDGDRVPGSLCRVFAKGALIANITATQTDVSDDTVFTKRIEVFRKSSSRIDDGVRRVVEPLTGAFDDAFDFSFG